MKIKVDLSEKYLINILGNDFPFDKVRMLMDAVEWRYFDSPDTPTLDRIKNMLIGLVKSSKTSSENSCGGFEVTQNNGNYNIKFLVGTFIFSTKSDEWDGGDLLHFNSFIHRLESIFGLLSSPIITLLKVEQKIAFFKKRCDDFIENGDEYLYDCKLQYSITKIDNGDDISPSYELKFIGVDKDYYTL